VGVALAGAEAAGEEVGGGVSGGVLVHLGLGERG
jgi:hypothetical protein